MQTKRNPIMHDRLYLERKMLGINQQQMSDLTDIGYKTYHTKERGVYRFCEDEMVRVQKVINNGRAERGEDPLSLEELFETKKSL